MKPASYVPSFAIPSLEAHLNLTGLRALIKSNPKSKVLISVLSLLSEREVILVTWQRKADTALLPKVTSLEAVAEVATASFTN